MPHNLFNSLQEFKLASGGSGKYYALSALESAGLGKLSRMPYSLRIVLESVLRNYDGKRVAEDHVKDLAGWRPDAPRTTEISFVLARILLQDMAGFPALNDFAAMRATAQRLGGDPQRIEPLVPVDLVVDHSVEVDVHGTPDAVQRQSLCVREFMPRPPLAAPLRCDARRYLVEAVNAAASIHESVKRLA